MSITYTQEQIEDIKKCFEAYGFQRHLYPNYQAGEFNDVEEWILSWFLAKNKIHEMNLETCPKCNFDPDKTFGAAPCKVCGMIGQMPWGG